MNLSPAQIMVVFHGAGARRQRKGGAKQLAAQLMAMGARVDIVRKGMSDSEA